MVALYLTTAGSLLFRQEGNYPLPFFLFWFYGSEGMYLIGVTRQCKQAKVAVRVLCCLLRGFQSFIQFRIYSIYGLHFGRVRRADRADYLIIRDAVILINCSCMSMFIRVSRNGNGAASTGRRLVIFPCCYCGTFLTFVEATRRAGAIFVMRPTMKITRVLCFRVRITDPARLLRLIIKGRALLAVSFRHVVLRRPSPFRVPNGPVVEASSRGVIA